MQITTELVVVVTALIGAVGVLMYQSPARAWRLLAESYEARIKSVEAGMTRLEAQLERKDEELEQRDGEIRRLRTIRSVLENMLRVAGIDVPRFAAGQHPEIAPERRDPPMDHPIVVVETTTPPPTGEPS